MKKLLLPLILLYLSSATYAQLTFQKRISNISASQTALAIDNTSDGGYVIGGAGLVPFSTGDIYMMKIDSVGDSAWAAIFSGTNDGAAYDIIESDDGGVISTGYYAGTGSGTNAFLFKTNSDGTLQWMKEYGGNLAETSFSLKQSNDHSYIIAGYTMSLTATNEDVYLVKTNSAGAMLWNSTYSSSGGNERGNCIALTNDGGYIITGRINGAGSQGDDLILFKTDSSGAVSWAKKFATSGDETGNFVAQASDGGFLVAGTISFVGGFDAVLIKTDSAGNLMWTKKYHHLAQNSINKMLLRSNGQILLTGSTSPSSINGSKFLTICADSSGNPLWTRVYGGTSGDASNGIVASSDGGLVMTGIGDLYANVLVVKTDSSGNSGCFDSLITMTVDTTQLVASVIFFSVFSVGIETNSTPSLVIGGQVTTVCLTTGVNDAPVISDLKVYPNPANEIAEIDCSEFTGKINLRLLNSMGQMIYSKVYENESVIRLDVADLSNGIYYLSATDGKIISSSPLVICR